MGPYKYREYQNYNNIVYDKLNNEIDNQSLSSVSMDYSQDLVHQRIAEETFDTPMYLTNQALFKRWYKLNTA